MPWFMLSSCRFLRSGFNQFGNMSIGAIRIHKQETLDVPEDAMP